MEGERFLSSRPYGGVFVALVSRTYNLQRLNKYLFGVLLIVTGRFVAQILINLHAGYIAIDRRHLLVACACDSFITYIFPTKKLGCRKNDTFLS